VLLFILIIRGVTLPGSTSGLLYYLTPNWEMLKDGSVWINAYGQVFFSLSLGFGILIAYASYMPRESDVTNSAFITSLGNCATSFLAGMAVFSVLGYLATVSNQPIDGVVTAGPGLVFVTYPVALSQMPVGTAGVAIISLLFFVCLITLGIDSAFSLVEGIVTGFRDRFPALNRGAMTAVACLVGLAGSLFFCTRSGLMWLDIVDNWMNNYGLPLVGLLECIAVGYFFHLRELKGYINEHSEIKVHNWFDAFIKFVTPAILVYLLAQQFLGDVTSVYGGYDLILDHSVTLAGWGWYAFLICVALFLARDHKALFGVLAAAVLFVLILVYFRATARGDVGLGQMVAPAVMAAIAATILFGGLAVCISIARRTHHMAGLSLEEAGEGMEPMENLDEAEDTGDAQGATELPPPGTPGGGGQAQSGPRAEAPEPPEEE
jgi:NSS family neurotransmitter:Na+ symporter